MKSLLHFSRRYLLRFFPWYIGGTLALFATNWMTVTIPLYVAQGLDALPLGEAGRDAIWESIWVIGVLGALVILVRTASRLLFFTPGRLVEAQVKRDLFARIIEHQPAFLRQWPTGDLISRASSDVNMLRLFAGFTVLGIINTVVALVLAGTQMYRLSPTLALWVITPLMVAFGVTIFAARYLHTLMRILQRQAAELSDHILSSYQGVATIQSFRSGPAFFKRFDTTNRDYLLTTLKRANLRTVIGPTLSLAAAVNVFILLYLGGPMAMRGEITVGELVAFTTLVAMLTGPLRGMSFIISLFKQAQASLERIDAILLAEPERPELPNPEPAPTASPEIELKNLTFAYPDDPEELVLQDVSLRIPSGGTLGILGLTGSGKTTLLRCIARLYNPPPGTVFIDGVDIIRMDLEGWRRAMSYVPQRAFLFSESVKDNILLGAPDDGRLEAVLERAALAPDIEALPKGDETLVGESGVMLSGGQRQRTALARGLVRPHQVLILDDVLSAVDHHTEQELIDSIQSTPQRPTTIIVANRISAIQHAELIVVLEKGRVVESGTHEALCMRQGLYRDTWERQSELTVEDP